LNWLGTQGWEAYHVAGEFGSFQIYYYLKRPKARR
jgi:hypothetical protein